MDDDEGPRERVNREFIEMLNELRVVLPGVQILFAFLLTVPFNNAWSKATGFQRGVFYFVLLSVTASLAALLAPTAYHRLRFRDGVKERNLLLANHFIRAGLTALAVATTGAVVLLSDFLFGTGAAIAGGVFAASLFTFCWWAVARSDAIAEARGEMPRLSTPEDTERHLGVST